MSTIRESIERFHTLVYPPTNQSEKDFLPAIFKHPILDVIEDYVRFYNEPDHQMQNWHFWWIFSEFPLPNQLELIEKAIKTAAENRTAFDNRILAEGRLIDLLNTPKDSEHKTLFKMLKYGWNYYLEVCRPSPENITKSLSELIKEVKSLVKQSDQEFQRKES